MTERKSILVRNAVVGRMIDNRKEWVKNYLEMKTALLLGDLPFGRKTITIGDKNTLIAFIELNLNEIRGNETNLFRCFTILIDCDDSDALYQFDEYLKAKQLSFCYVPRYLIMINTNESNNSIQNTLKNNCNEKNIKYFDVYDMNTFDIMSTSIVCDILDEPNPYNRQKSARK